MNGEPLKRWRVLGVAHMVVGLASFIPAAVAGLWIAPLALGPIWFCVLGVWLWRPTGRLSTALVATHAINTIFAVLNVAFGIGALKAGERSAQKGGGIMSGIGLYPVMGGILLLVLAGASFWAAYSMRAKAKTPEVPLASAK